MKSSVKRTVFAGVLVLLGEGTSSHGPGCESMEQKLACACRHTLVHPGGEASVPRKAGFLHSGAAHLALDPGPLRGHHSDQQARVSLCLPLSITDSEDDGESEAAKQLIQPIAEKIIAKYKAKEEEAPLLFFVAGEVSATRAGLAGWLLEHK